MEAVLLDGGMWGSHDGMGWWMVFGGMLWILFWGSLIYLIVSAVGGFGRRRQEDSDALGIAQRRYASGEISREEFERVKNDLRL
jgi:putative membrane protein